MKKIVPVIVLAAASAFWFALYPDGLAPTTSAPSSSAASSIEALFAQRQSDVQVRGEGVVVRILSDDNKGSRHQRFILKLASGHTLLIAHNIDLATRVEGLKVGDHVEFFGEYEWNERGGVIHWTHHDPKGRHVAGWLKHNGRIYQ
ncbi:MAG: DUF3465 domain-containing protein [Gammaproteobacteria bacterium]|nr:hypothetical protein [Gammaproteobacteria bacterium]